MNTLAVCDHSKDYGKRLGEYAKNRGGYPFMLQIFSSLEQLMLYREKREPDAVLLAEALYRESDWLEYAHPLFLLGSGLGDESGPPCIYRYQEADVILREILQLYQKQQPEFAMEVEKHGFTLYAITDASESCRSEQLAFFLAQQIAEKEKVLWLDLRTWSSFGETMSGNIGGDLGQILYALCRQKEDLIKQILTMVSPHAKVDILPTIAEPADYFSLTIKLWKELFDRLKRESPYTAVVVVTGNLLQPLGCFLELFDVIWMVWEERNMLCQKRLERYIKNTACPQLWQRIQGVQLPADPLFAEEEQHNLRHLAKKILEDTWHDEK